MKGETELDGRGMREGRIQQAGATGPPAAAAMLTHAICVTICAQLRLKRHEGK